MKVIETCESLYKSFKTVKKMNNTSLVKKEGTDLQESVISVNCSFYYSSV